MNAFQDFIETCEKSKRLDPWAAERDAKAYGQELAGEVREVLEAIDKKDCKNMKEELGDVLIDWAHTCLSAGIGTDEVITAAIDKLKRRKPFLLENRNVTKQEAKRLWLKAKQQEKA